MKRNLQVTCALLLLSVAASAATEVTIETKGTTRQVVARFGGAVAEKLYQALKVDERVFGRLGHAKNVSTPDGAAELQCVRTFNPFYHCAFTGRLWDATKKLTATSVRISTDEAAWWQRPSPLFEKLALPVDGGIDPGFTGPTKTLTTDDDRFLLRASQRNQSAAFVIQWPKRQVAHRVTTQMGPAGERSVVALSESDSLRLMTALDVKETDFGDSILKGWKSENGVAQIFCQLWKQPRPGQAKAKCSVSLEAVHARDYLRTSTRLDGNSIVELYRALQLRETICRGYTCKQFFTADGTLSMTIGEQGTGFFAVRASEPGSR